MKVDGARSAFLVLGAGLLIGLGLGIVILYGMGLRLDLHWLQVKTSNQDGVGLSVGNTAPDFALVNLEGETVRLSDYRGKPVLINFWATWCSPCVLEMPNIEKTYEKYNQSFEVLAVNADEPEGQVSSFVKDLGVHFTVLLDPGGKVQSDYQLRGYPTSYFVDGDGKIAIQHIGFMSEDNLTHYLSQLGVVP